MTAALTDSEFAFVAQEAKTRSGLVLSRDKEYLIETRLTPVSRRAGYETLRDAIAAARRSPQLVDAFVDALTTNETFFFRDKTPFDIFRDTVLPDLMSRRPAGSRLKIWCAACSTGQEPYSLAMLALDLRAQGKSCEMEIVATDISERVLEKARLGVYSQFEVQRGLPIQSLVKHFEKSNDAWRVNDRVRPMVRFQKHNLLDDPRPLGRFDVVFCRNVLIYFDADAKRRTLEAVAGVMGNDGALFLGAAETVMGLTEAFTPAPDRRGLYLKNPAWKAGGLPGGMAARAG